VTVVITRPSADADMDEIIDHLTKRAGDQIAADYADRFAAQIVFISQFPRAYERRPRLGRLVRQGLVAPYNIIYAYDPDTDTATILRVLHGRRRITRKLIQG
jgi:toxin ParE1/3/4